MLTFMMKLANWQNKFAKITLNWQFSQKISRLFI